MHEDRDKGFEQEYLVGPSPPPPLLSPSSVVPVQTFSTEPTAVHDAAKDPRNKNKNRFANIFPCKPSSSAVHSYT